jgi:hypothetical protein
MYDLTLRFNFDVSQAQSVTIFRIKVGAIYTNNQNDLAEIYDLGRWFTRKFRNLKHTV